MSTKMYLSNENYFLLLTFLLLIMFYVCNLKSMQNIDLDYGLNNNLIILSEQMRRFDDFPIFKNQLVQKTTNNLTDNDVIMTNLNGTVDKELILTNQPTDILEQPTKVLISNPLQLESSLAVPDIQKRFALENRDRDAVFNEFRAPERRDPEHAYPTKQVKDMINLPTRGLPDNYHSVGVLVRKKDEKVLQLFGRQKYPGSSQWEYYVSGADSYGFPNKMPVVVRGDKELDDKQKIELPWLDKSKGDFEVNLYNYDVPRYNPFAF